VPLAAPWIGRSGGTAATILTLAGDRLPDWCDSYLAPPDAGDIFASRLWFDTTLAHALPPGAQPLLACREGAAVLPLLRHRGRIGSLTTAYSLEWRPLTGAAPAPGALREAGEAFGRWRRGRRPARLEAMAATPELEAMLAGLARTGITVQRYDHFGNWHAVLPQRSDWADYLAARPPALRTTIRRKLERARRDFRFDLADSPGAALEAGIAAYEAVRAQSWKPAEPAPMFDAALIRAAAAAGAVRLGVLRETGGLPVAAQYWLVSGARAWLLKLCHAEASRGASPGTVLTALMIRRLIEHDAARELDFGRGDDAYKQLWVEMRRQRIGVELAHVAHPSGLLAILRHRVARRYRDHRASGLAVPPPSALPST
jgi:hypothetical protein